MREVSCGRGASGALDAHPLLDLVHGSGHSVSSARVVPAVEVSDGPAQAVDHEGTRLRAVHIGENAAR